MSKAKIQEMKKKVLSKPDSIKAHLDLLSAVVEDGNEVVLRHELASSLQTLDKGPLLPERFHKPLIKMLKEFALGKHIEMVCRDLEIHYAEDLEDDTSIKSMIRRGRKAFKESTHFPSIYPEVHGELWWQFDDIPQTHPDDPDATLEQCFRCVLTLDPALDQYLNDDDPVEYELVLLIIAAHDEDNFPELLEATTDKQEILDNLGSGTYALSKRLVMAYYSNEETLYFFEE